MKILVIRNDKLGDFVQAFPAFAMLKASNPELKLTALVPAYTAPLAQICPYLDDVIIDSAKNDKADFNRLVKEIKEQQFDGMISFFSNTHNGKLAWKSGIPYRLAPATKWVQILYNHRLTQRRSRSEKSEAEYNQDLARAFLKKHNMPIVEPKPPYLSLPESAVKNHQAFSEQDGEKGRDLCLSIADTLKLDSQHPAIVQWKKQLNESYSAREVTHLFSQTVLQSFDRKAKKLITKMAAESAVIVAISPLAVIDMFFITWRNIRLINKIAAIYGIELGYFTRLRLLRMVLVNLAFAGATEIVQDLGMDWLSQDITAKLSARAAQGIGVGLLTARLGIKAMEFCRPLAFEKSEKPKLSHVQKELLTVMKDTVLGKTKVKEKEEV